MHRGGRGIVYPVRFSLRQQGRRALRQATCDIVWHIAVQIIDN